MTLKIKVNPRYLVKPFENLRKQVPKNKKPFYSSSISHVVLKIFKPKLMLKMAKMAKKTFSHTSSSLHCKVHRRNLAKPFGLRRKQISKSKKAFSTSDPTLLVLKIFYPKLMQKRQEKCKKVTFLT